MAMEQIPHKQDISFVRGDSFSFDVTFNTTDEELTINDIRFSARSNYDDSYYLFCKSIDNGITHVAGRTYRVRIAPEDTASLQTGKYYYDLQVDVGGARDIFTLLRGRLELLWDVTRRGRNEH
ncbi:MAG: hypothetical protein IJT28_08090 [Bacteroidaceae bacterium]|nr:hypothetical protein [Bacteroidaceae bacterium]